MVASKEEMIQIQQTKEKPADVWSMIEECFWIFGPIKTLVQMLHENSNTGGNLQILRYSLDKF